MNFLGLRTLPVMLLTCSAGSALAGDLNAAFASEWDGSRPLYEIRVPPTRGDTSLLVFKTKDDIRPRYAVNLWGTSYHMKRPTLLNERNWGLGLRKWDDEDSFDEVNVVKDSFKGIAYSVSHGTQYRLVKSNNSSFSGRIEYVYINYGFAPELHRKPRHIFAVFPGFALERGNVSAEMRIVPKKDLRHAEVLLFNLSVRTNFFE